MGAPAVPADVLSVLLVLSERSSSKDADYASIRTPRQNATRPRTASAAGLGSA